MLFRAATFNAGLAVGLLPWPTERLPHVVGALAELDVDLLFVQEFWLEPHWDELVRAAARSFPHSFRAPPTQPAVKGACSEEELEPLVACARAHCDGRAGDELGRCVVRSCAATAASMSTACLNCVVSHPVGTLEEILAPCIGSGAKEATPPRAPTAGMVAYGGSFGTGLLARTPLLDRDAITFEASVNARGALYARLADPPLHVFATHLSPGIHDEQAAQIDRLLAWVDEKAGAAPAMLLGDLNTGPDASPSLYRRFEAAGFVDPYRAGCTYCHGALGHGRAGESGWILDHVLFRGVDGDLRANRILDDELVIDVRGTRVRTTYSDHFGVVASLSR